MIGDCSSVFIVRCRCRRRLEEMASTSMMHQDNFTAIPLNGELSQEKPKKIKVPRRILHFSDGTLEEYSTDEEDSKDSRAKTAVNPKTLHWLPWFIYYLSTGARKSLAVADFCGEKLAWLFGITSPKYGNAIQEYNRMQKELAEDQRKGNQDSQEVQTLSSIDVQVVGGKDGSCDVKVTSNAPSSVELKY